MANLEQQLREQLSQVEQQLGLNTKTETEKPQAEPLDLFVISPRRRQSAIEDHYDRCNKQLQRGLSERLWSISNALYNLTRLRVQPNEHVTPGHVHFRFCHNLLSDRPVCLDLSGPIPASEAASYFWDLANEIQDEPWLLLAVAAGSRPQLAGQ